MYPESWPPLNNMGISKYTDKNLPSSNPLRLIAYANIAITINPRNVPTTVTKIETDSLETILHNIKDFPLGTAGSVSKGYQIVYKLLNYTQNSDFTADEAKKDYANFKSDLSDTQKIQYEENLFEIDYIARQVIENPDILTQHIENCDPISDDGEISLSSYEKLYKIISE